MLALAAEAVRRPNIATLAIGVFGAVVVLIAVVVFRFIYFDRSADSRTQVGQDRG